MMATYLTSILLAAVIFTGIIFDTNEWLGEWFWLQYRLMLFLFVTFVTALLLSILGKFSWILRRRYRAPIVSRPAASI